MKIIIYLLSITVSLCACTNNSSKFTGTWQKINDPTSFIVITESGNNFLFETYDKNNFGERLPASYDEEKDKIDVNTKLGTNVFFIFDENSQHLLGAGEEFQKILPTSSTEKAQKFIGTWEYISDSKETFTIIQLGDNFIVNHMQQMITTKYIEKKDELLGHDQMGDISFRYDKTSNTLLVGDREDIFKKKD